MKRKHYCYDCGKEITSTIYVVDYEEDIEVCSRCAAASEFSNVTVSLGDTGYDPS